MYGSGVAFCEYVAGGMPTILSIRGRCYAFNLETAFTNLLDGRKEDKNAGRRNWLQLQSHSNSFHP